MECVCVVPRVRVLPGIVKAWGRRAGGWTDTILLGLALDVAATTNATFVPLATCQEAGEKGKCEFVWVLGL